jgi:hypothetical protein
MAEFSDNHPNISPERRKQLREGILDRPERSYLLSGPSRYGKTRMMEELFERTPFTKARQHSQCFLNAKEWQDSMTDAANGRYHSPTWGNTKESDGSNVYPLVSPRNLAAGQMGDVKAAVFIDDIDKLKGSDFINGEFWALLEVIMRQKHQLVLSTNLDKEQFYAHFGRTIAGRIIEHCVWVEFKDKQEVTNG